MASPALEDILAEAALDAQDSRIDEGEVLDALRSFGLRGSLKRILTEKDDTFVLTSPVHRERFLVKISSSYEDPGILDLQSSALTYAQARDSQLPIPHLIARADGSHELPRFSGSGPYPRLLRVLTYMEGVPLGSQPTNTVLRQNVGTLGGRLTRALEGMNHPRSERLIPWDLRHFLAMEPLLGYVDDSHTRHRVEEQFVIFEEIISPLLREVRFQVVHNDINRYNTLLDAESGTVCGVIDFGDVVRTAIPFDLAIAASGYLDPELSDPWDGVADIVSAYHRAHRLSDSELTVAVWAMPVRIALRTLLMSYQSALHPDRGDYLLSHANGNVALLDATAATTAPFVEKILSSMR